jgi:hypothetical protein
MWQLDGKRVSTDDFGSFHPVRVLVHYDFPRAFTFLAKDGGLRLAYWCSDDDADKDRFVVVPCTRATVQALAAGELPVRQALESQEIWIVDVGPAGIESAWQIPTLGCIPEDNLPAPDVRLQTRSPEQNR